MPRHLSAILCLLVAMVAAPMHAATVERPVYVQGSVAYFTRHNPARLLRFDMETQTWLPVTALPRNPTALEIDGDDIFIASGKSVYRYPLDFSTEVLFATVANNIREIYTDGDVLFINHTQSIQTTITSVNKISGAVIENYTTTVGDGAVGTVIDRSSNTIYGGTYSSGYGIISISYTDAGDLVTAKETPYSSGANWIQTSRLWLNESATRVISENGRIYNTDSLVQMSRVSASLTSADFDGNAAVFLKGSLLIALNDEMAVQGAELMSGTPEEVVVYHGNAFVFDHPDSGATGDTTFSVHAVAHLKLKPAGDVLNPIGLAYTPEAIYDIYNALLLVDNDSGMVYVWGAEEKRYLTAFALHGKPISSAFSLENYTLYLAFGDGLITKLNLAREGGWLEEPFAISMTTTPTVSSAGPTIVVSDGSESRSYSPTGTLISTYSGRVGLFPQWDPVTGKLFSLESSYLSVARLGGNGAITSITTLYPSSSTVRVPLKLFDNNSKILMGSGGILDVAGGTQINSLPNRIGDACWYNGQLYTIYQPTSSSSYYHQIAPSDYSYIQKWSSVYAQTSSTTIQGQPLRLLNIGGADGLCLITLSSGVPQFTGINGDLDLVWTTFDKTGSLLQSGSVSTNGATIQWDGSDYAGATAYIDVFNNSTLQWVQVGTTEARSGSYTVTGLSPDTDYLFRMRLGQYQKAEVISTDYTAIYYPGLLLENMDFSDLDYLTFELKTGDTWKPLRYSSANGGSQGLTLYFDRTTLTAGQTFDMRVTKRTNVHAKDDISPRMNYKLHLNWFRHEDGDYPFQIYKVISDYPIVLEPLETVGADVFNKTYTSTSPEGIAPVVVYAILPDGSFDEVYEQITYEMSMEWDPVSGALGYDISDASWGDDYYYTAIYTEETHYQYRYSDIFSGSGLYFEDFWTPKVQAVSGVTVTEIPSRIRLQAQVSFPSTSGSYGSALQYRDTSDGVETWVTLGNYYSGSNSYYMEVDEIPMFRLVRTTTVNDYTLGTTSVRTAQFFVDNLTGSVATDGNGNRYTNWFGHYWFNPAVPDYIYSYDYGWCYLSRTSGGGVWIWSAAMGWMYWNASMNDIVFIANRGTWFLHFKGGNWYYNYSTSDYEQI